MNPKPRIKPSDLTADDLIKYQKLQSRDHKTVSSVIDASDYNRLKWFAYGSGQSVSEVIRRAIQPYVLMMPSEGPEGFVWRDERRAA